MVSVSDISCSSPFDANSELPDHWDIYGDNLDCNKGVFHRTLDNQNESIHWFLLVGAPQRVKPTCHLSIERPRRNILTVENQEFTPSIEDHHSLLGNFEFHVAEILVKYLGYLQPFSSSLPKYIDHEFVTEMSKKHEYRVIDLLKKMSQNVIT